VPKITITETLDYLFDHKPHLLLPRLAGWMSESFRFATFVETYRDKIRKKIRTIPEAEGFYDLQAELETAYLLLQEKRFTLAYEPYGKGTGRGPDFVVTFRTNLTFNVEVTRLRLLIQENNTGQKQAEQISLDYQYESRRLAEIVGSKLHQTLPSMMNLLVIVADDGAICELDLDKVLIGLKHRAEQKDLQLFKRHDFRDSSDFFKHYQRLSAVLLRGANERENGKCPLLWLNNQAKHPLPAPICVILRR
jgi:hypothetical protein